MKDIEKEAFEKNKQTLKNNRKTKHAQQIKEYVDSITSPVRTVMSNITSSIEKRKQKQKDTAMAENCYADYFTKIETLEKANTYTLKTNEQTRITAYPTEHGPIIQTIINTPEKPHNHQTTFYEGPYTHHTVSFEGFIPTEDKYGNTLIEYLKVIKDQDSSIYSKTICNLQLTSISRNMHGKFSVSRSNTFDRAKTIVDLNNFFKECGDVGDKYKFMRDQYVLAKKEFETTQTLEK